MAENKQYITQVQDNGSILISEDVVETIVARAVMEVEGVVGLNNRSGSELADVVDKKKWGKAIRVEIGENNAFTVTCDVVASYGHSVVKVAHNVQSSVAAALESTTGRKAKAVHVNVTGIVRQ